MFYKITLITVMSLLLSNPAIKAMQQPFFSDVEFWDIQDNDGINRYVGFTGNRLTNGNCELVCAVKKIQENRHENIYGTVASPVPVGQDKKDYLKKVFKDTAHNRATAGILPISLVFDQLSNAYIRDLTAQQKRAQAHKQWVRVDKTVE